MLQAGHTVYAGRGGRTNGEGIRQLRSLLAPLGRTVVAVPLGKVLHLKSAVTALPDGTFLLQPSLESSRFCRSQRQIDLVNRFCGGKPPQRVNQNGCAVQLGELLGRSLANSTARGGFGGDHARA